jgi:hypothetical protein
VERPWRTRPDVLDACARGALGAVISALGSAGVTQGQISALTSVPALARWLLGLGIAATLAANVAHGLGHGLIGAAVAAWPAVALVGSYELLMMVIRNAQGSANSASGAGQVDAPSDPDPLHVRAAQVFADDLASCRVPSVRTIRA